jgi:hypothetical protein
MHSQVRIVRPQYSTEPDCAATRDMPRFGCALCCNIGAIYIAHTLQFMQCGLWSRTYTMNIHLHIFRIQYSTKRICAACWRYVDNSVSLILQSWCQIQRSSSSLRHVTCGPGHVQSIYSSAYICFNIRWNVSALLLAIIGHFEARYTANWEPNIAHIIRFTPCGLWSRTYTM